MKIIGHRGGIGLLNENTLKGFFEAISHKVDEIEFDVRVSKDNIPVIYHDAKLHCISGKDLVIKNTKLRDLQKQKPDLTTLKEVFEKIDKKVSLYIEIKPDVPTKPIINILKNQIKKGHPVKNMRIASFSQNILLEVKSAIPEITIIINESWNSRRAIKRARALQTRVISMSQRWMWRGFVRYMHNRGYELYAYTINKPSKAQKLRSHGLAGIVTDFPDRFKH